MTSWRSEIRVLYRPLPKTPQYLVFCGVFSCQNALRLTARHDLTCVGYVKSCSSSYQRSPHQRRSLHQRRECPLKSWAVDAANARPESPCWWCYWGCRVTGPITKHKFPLITAIGIPGVGHRRIPLQSIQVTSHGNIASSPLPWNSLNERLFPDRLLCKTLNV